MNELYTLDLNDVKEVLRVKQSEKKRRNNAKLTKKTVKVKRQFFTTNQNVVRKLFLLNFCAL